jgi:hypothetical protein
MKRNPMIALRHPVGGAVFAALLGRCTGQSSSSEVLSQRRVPPNRW